jgi:subtilisin family serine protease
MGYLNLKFDKGKIMFLLKGKKLWLGLSLLSLAAVVEAKTSVIVYFQLEQATPDKNLLFAELNRSLAEQRELLQFAEDQHLEIQKFPVAQAILFRDISPKQLGELRKLKSSTKIRIDRRIPGGTKPEFAKVDRAIGVESNISVIGAERVWQEFGLKGEGIVIASADTGVQWNHPALIHNYRGNTERGVEHQYNWYDAVTEQISNEPSRCGYGSLEPCDGMGHGTHTTGTAVGDDQIENQIGVASGAQWVACRNMDWGDGRISTYLACFQWLLAPFADINHPERGKPELAPNIVINSYACPEEEGCAGDEFAEALQNLKRAGIMMVAAAGNFGNECGTINAQPASHSDTTLSVGAFDHVTGRIAGFSSRGPSTYDHGLGPNLTAPGVMIRSAIPRDSYAHMLFSGTSMAAPHVAGAIALLWQADPGLKGNIDATVALLQRTADPEHGRRECGGVEPNAIPNNTFGYGKINIYNAVAELQQSTRVLVEQTASDGIQINQKLAEFATPVGLRRVNLSAVNMVRFMGPKSKAQDLLKKLAKISGIRAYVEQPKEFYVEKRLQNLHLPDFSSRSWSIARTGVDKLWDLGFFGENVTVAVIDGGTDYRHPDLSTQLWINPREIENGFDDDLNGYVDDVRGWNFVDNSDDNLKRLDHGTMVTGVLTGNGTMGRQTGVAPKVKYVPLLACCVTDNGTIEGFESDVWEAIQYVINLKQIVPSIGIITMSLGVVPWAEPRWEIWRQFGEALLQEDILHVNAAGNFADMNPQNNIVAPASNPPAWLSPSLPVAGGRASMISVGAVGPEDQLMSYSSLGPTSWYFESFTDYPLEDGGLVKPDICAPSEVPSTYHGVANNFGYVNYFGGTSAAAPHIAGIAAILRGAFREARVSDITEALISSATPFEGQYTNKCGGGMVNAEAAFLWLRAKFQR